MKVLLVLLALTLTGCESLKLRNAVKTTATTAVTYITAGPIPAVLSLGTSVLVDETLPPENTIDDVKTKEQMWAFIMKELFVYGLYSIIALLAFTSVIGPWAADRRRKRKMKYDALRDEVKAHRLQGLNVKKEETDGR
jgi:ABC-type uncharacterized transport system permease subunit